PSDAGPEPGVPEPGGQAPPWGDEPFDPDAAWKLIQGLRGDKERTTSRNAELEAQLKAFEDAKLTDQERAARQAEELKAQAAAHARENLVLKEAMAAGLTADHLPFITGDTPEQVRDNIRRLRALLQAGGPQTPAGRPREQPLRAGTDPNPPAGNIDPLRHFITSKTN
ncbi:MAG: DUF4355 domain-containing protein, partial [Bifidobacteriaceae bacterium]|nr:DUF4355 domain-containing protein [Bifidobacteriaceae bacterium]